MRFHKRGEVCILLSAILVIIWNVQENIWFYELILTLWHGSCTRSHFKEKRGKQNITTWSSNICEIISVNYDKMSSISESLGTNTTHSNKCCWHCLYSHWYTLSSHSHMLKEKIPTLAGVHICGGVRGDCRCGQRSGFPVAAYAWGVGISGCRMESTMEVTFTWLPTVWPDMMLNYGGWDVSDKCLNE